MRARSTLLRPVIPWHYEETAIRKKLIREIAGMEVAAKAGAKPNRHAAPAASSLGVRARSIVVISDCDG